MRLLLWLFAIAIVALLARARWQRWRRARRGEPEPDGPRTITLIIVALVVVYSLWIGYRLLVGR